MHNAYNGPFTTAEVLALVKSFASTGVENMMTLVRDFNTYARNRADSARQMASEKEREIVAKANQLEIEEEARRKAAFREAAEAWYAETFPPMSAPEMITRDQIEDIHDAYCDEQEAAAAKPKKGGAK